MQVHDTKHKNLTAFYGATFTHLAGHGQIFSVSELCEKGSLKRLLHSNVLLADIQFRLAFIRDVTEARGSIFFELKTVTRDPLPSVSLLCCRVCCSFTSLLLGFMVI